MNKPAATPWYRVAEVWLILILLGTTVVGSLSLVATALNSPDRHLSVPDDVPRHSRLPPIRDEGASAAPAPASAPVEPQR